MSKLFTTESIASIVNYLKDIPEDIVVVCGFDNVGKGTVLDALSNSAGPQGKTLPVFHPDYSLICDQVQKSGRWSYFMYFLDIYSSFSDSLSIKYPMIFDRSALCGAVYNNDYQIAVQYANRIENKEKVLHILVTCDENSYNKFISVRGNNTKFTYNDYLIHTERYRCYLDLLDLKYIEYRNVYDEAFGDFASKVCGGCSHFKSDHCVHPECSNKKVSYDTERCQYSNSKEVQDFE